MSTNSLEEILLVDDDPDFLAIVERFASALGFAYTSTPSSLAAIELLKSRPFNVVVTDMVMPNLDGMELLKFTKDNLPDTDVIVMTGFSRNYTYIDVIKAGASDFIEKPFKKDEFGAKLSRVFKERQLLQELTSAKKAAEAASEAKTSFLNTISHELRTPMNAILGFTDLLHGTELSSSQQQYLGLVADASRKLMDIITQILEFTSHSSEGDLKFSECNIACIVNEVMAALQELASANNCQLQASVDPDLRHSSIRSDHAALHKIIHNLVDNAIKFSPHDEIRITATTKGRMEANKILLQVSVHDHGCGIAPAQQKMIFEPFTQAEKYMTRCHEGLGLGLAACAQLVKLLGGKIWLESQVGQGSTFYFAVPVTVK